MPFNAEPDQAGTFALDDTHARYVGPPDLFDRTPRHASHFATCPQADEWRKDPRR